MARDLVNLDNVYANNLGTLEKICKVVNPSIEFPASFFEELFPKDTKKDTYFAQMAYFSEIPVAGIKSKLYPKRKGDNYPKGVCIEIMATLENYEGHGINDKFLEYVADECKKHHQHLVYTHLPMTEEKTIQWYKDNGFESEGDALKDFIKTVDGPVDAVLLKKHYE